MVTLYVPRDKGGQLNVAMTNVQLSFKKSTKRKLVTQASSAAKCLLPSRTSTISCIQFRGQPFSCVHASKVREGRVRRTIDRACAAYVTHALHPIPPKKKRSPQQATQHNARCLPLPPPHNRHSGHVDATHGSSSRSTGTPCPRNGLNRRDL